MPVIVNPVLWLPTAIRQAGGINLCICKVFENMHLNPFLDFCVHSTEHRAWHKYVAIPTILKIFKNPALALTFPLEEQIKRPRAEQMILEVLS